MFNNSFQQFFKVSFGVAAFLATQACIPAPILQKDGLTGDIDSVTVATSPSPSPSSSATPVAATYSLANTSTAIKLTARQTTSGSVYYALFSADPGTLTASQVKQYAQGSLTSGSVAAVGTLAVTVANTDYDAVLTVADKVLYTLYAVGENADGLDTDANVKKYEKVLPKRVSLQTYATALNGTGSALGKTIRYSVYFPTNYYNTTATVPVLFYLGGAGELPNDSSNPETIFTTGQYRINKTPYISNIEGGRDYPFIVVTPQCNSGLFTCSSYADREWTHEVVTTIESTYRVDSKRMYMVGMSNGGGGVWNYIIKYPNKIAAAVPVAATSFSYTTGTTGTLCVASRSNLAVWAINNTNDSVVSPSYSTNAATAWNACSGKTDTTLRTLLPGNVYPATASTHNTIEYVVGARYVRYSPTPATLDPDGLGELAIESTLAGELDALGFDRIEEWLLTKSKP